jgi:hypothetical protein
VQEHDQNTTAEKSVDGGGVPAQNLTNDGLIFVLFTDLVKSPEDDVQPESHHEPARVGEGTLGAGENPDTTAEEVIFMTTVMDDDPTG